MRDFLGEGIFAIDGPAWYVLPNPVSSSLTTTPDTLRHMERKTTSYIFSGNSFRGVITSSLGTHLPILIEVMPRYVKLEQPMAFDQVLSRFTFDTFVCFAFGQQLGSLESDQVVPFARAFDYAQGRLNTCVTGVRVGETF